MISDESYELGAVLTAQPAIRIAAGTLRMLLGEGSVAGQSLKRSDIERMWRCGCRANYTVTQSEEVAWTPCGMHLPAIH